MNHLLKIAIIFLTITFITYDANAQGNPVIHKTTLQHTITKFVKESQDFNEARHDIIEESMRDLQEQVDMLLGTLDNIPYPMPIPLNNYQIHSFHQNNLTIVTSESENIQITVQIEFVAKLNNVDIYKVDSKVHLYVGF